MNLAIADASPHLGGEDADAMAQGLKGRAHPVDVGDDTVLILSQRPGR